MASSSAWEHLASSLLVLHGWKGLRECGSDKQGCLKPGFPGHVLSLHLRPSPRQNLGTKRIFCPLQGSASHKNKLAETHVPGRGWEVGGTAQTASERNFHSVLRCLRQGFGSEEQILHQSLEEMHKTGRSGEQRECSLGLSSVHGCCTTGVTGLALQSSCSHSCSSWLEFLPAANGLRAGSVFLLSLKQTCAWSLGLLWISRAG